ncbi:putative indoleacetaldoxime dehydratase [Helianthus annuus]|nr:putative indoleacetaldoxime dehydratase [Helianthus annuus]
MDFITFRYEKNLPPSPWKLPVIGNLHQLGSHPYRALQALSQKYGPIMHLHFGSVPMTLCSLVLSVAELEENYGSTVDISALFDSLTTNIVYMAALGKTSDVVGSYVPWLSWVDRLTGLLGRAETVAKEFDAFLEVVIKEHVRKTGGEGAKTNHY